MSSMNLPRHSWWLLPIIYHLPPPRIVWLCCLANSLSCSCVLQFDCLLASSCRPEQPQLCQPLLVAVCAKPYLTVLPSSDLHDFQLSPLGCEPKTGQFRSSLLSKRTKIYPDVQGLGAMELIFFIASHMVLCFGFVTKTALLTHRWFSYCSQCLLGTKAFPAPHADTQRLGWGWVRGWERAQLGQLT